MQASNDSDFSSRQMSNNGCWIRALSHSMKIISTSSYQKGKIELKIHSTIMLQNLFAGSNYPQGRFYL